MIGRTLAALGVALLCLAPSCAAQPKPEVTIESHPPQSAVRPVKDLVVVPIEAYVSCTGTESAGPTKVTFKVDAPYFATAAVAPATVSRNVPPVECAPGAAKPFRTNVSIDFAPSTDPFTKQRFAMNVSVEKGPNFKYGPYAAEFDVDVAFLASFTLPDPRTTLMYRTGTLYVVVRNDGNGPLLVKKAIVNESAPFQTIEIGGDLRVERNGMGYEYWTIAAPRKRGVYTFTVAFNGTYGGDRPGVYDWQNQTALFTVDARESDSVFSPAPPAWAWTSAVLAITAWRRRTASR